MKETGPINLAGLRGVRLGKCARRILLLAPSPPSEPAIVAPAHPGRAASQSHLRAMHCLAANGLVELTWKREIVVTRQVRRGRGIVWDADAGLFRQVQADDVPVERTMERRAVRLTALGACLVDRIRPALENGRRVRWAAVADREQE